SLTLPTFLEEREDLLESLLHDHDVLDVRVFVRRHRGAGLRQGFDETASPAEGEVLAAHADEYGHAAERLRPSDVAAAAERRQPPSWHSRTVAPPPYPSKK